MLFSEIKKIELELSSDCNAECPLCSRTKLKMPLRGNNNLTLENIKKIFPDREAIKGKVFKFCGVLGDPIINKECLEIANWFDKCEAKKIQISTNGGLNNEEWWRELAKLKKVVVDFSVDGFEETNHIYRVNVKWNTVLRNMKAYRQEGGKGNWVFIPFDHNEDDYEKALSLAKKLGLNFIKRTSGRNNWRSNKKHKSHKMKKYIELKGSKELPHNDMSMLKELLSTDQLTDSLVRPIVSTMVCQHFNQPEVYIGSNMTMWPCCFLYDESISRYNDVVTSGDRLFNSLLHHSPDEILRNKFYKELKERWLPSNPTFLKRCLKSCGLKGVYKNKKEIVHE